MDFGGSMGFGRLYDCKDFVKIRGKKMKANEIDHVKIEVWDIHGNHVTFNDHRKTLAYGKASEWLEKLTR